MTAGRTADAPDAPGAPEPPDVTLAGIRVVSTATNLPGPVAASRLARMGATITKVEPPSGDPLAAVSRAYYDELVTGQSVQVLDLKQDSGRRALEGLLEEADLLLTASRAAALERLGLDWERLQLSHPRLSHVAIVGHPPPDEDLAGHDLTYQAAAGTLDPPVMPVVLLADLVGAERAVSEALAALVRRTATGTGSRHEVALSAAARDMGAPRRHGLTTPTGPLGGALPAYGIYSSADGYLALAALEPDFLLRLGELLGVSGTREELAAAFATRSSRDWQQWAREHDLPLAAVVGA